VTAAVSSLACAGCGTPHADGARPFPFQCVRARELPDVDHVIRRRLDAARLGAAADDRVNPFLRYRRFLHSYQFARDRGMSDAAYVDLVTRLDDAVARVDGHGFRVTPFQRRPELGAPLGIEAPGSVWVKDETGDVSGSHKARHLMGVMLYLQVVEALGLGAPRDRSLAIASCGNAALAAAVVARAAGYPLRVFVPATADAGVRDRMQELGACVEVCAREPGRCGDPAYLRFVQAVHEGALPFCCQGNENGLTIDGGETLAFEMAEALGDTRLDRLLIQVGGGALASSCLQGFEEYAAACGGAPPRVHAVQTRGAHPLERAFDRVRGRIARPDPAAIDEAMRYARAHRSAFMQPWEIEPHSVAHGILDDETYDWAALVEGMLRSGGSPIVVGEDDLHRANHIARDATGIAVDHTGSAGLAGLIRLVEREPAARREQTAVIFSGRIRPQPQPRGD
jgi:threonine synthase